MIEKYYDAPLMFSGLILLILLLSRSVGTLDAYEGFHHGMKSDRVNYDSLFKEARSISDSEKSQQLLEKCLNAYGGRENLKKIHSLQMIWQMKTIMMADSVQVVKSASFDRKYRIYRERENGFEARIINGNQSWLQNADTVLETAGGRYKSELFSYMVMGMPLILETEPFSETKYGQRRDDPLEYIYARKNDSLMIIIGIDPDDYLIKKAEGIIYHGDDEFVFVNKFDDYRSHNGFMFPHSLVNISMGLTVGNSVLLDVKVNPDLREDEFKPVSVHRYD